MEKTIVIIDGNSLINRAYYAMQRPMMTSEGIYTQGIFGFLNMLSKINTDYEPGYMAVAFDLKAPTFRHKEYDQYKAGRKKMPPELAMQMPLLKDVLGAMNIKMLEMEGFEADDIIGTIAVRAEEAGLEPLIITGDRDELQLATDVTRVLITKKGISQFEIYDKQAMIDKYGFTPTQFIDFKGLMGDQSDNIPGIPGVGEKTAQKLIIKYGSVEGLIEHVDELSKSKVNESIRENTQQAVMSKMLATINTNVPIDLDLEECKVEEPDYPELIKIYRKLEFNSFLKKLDSGEADLAAEGETAVDIDGQLPEQVIIKDKDDLKKIEDTFGKGASAVLKTFGNDDHKARPEVYGICLMSGSDFFYIDCGEEGMTEAAAQMLNGMDLKFSGHDLKKDYYALMWYGLEDPDTAFDAAIGQYVIDPSRSSYDIKTMAFEHLAYNIENEKDHFSEKGQVDMFGDVSADNAAYGAKWCVVTAAMEPLIMKEIEENGLSDVAVKAEFPLVKVMAAMEKEGIAVDVSVLKDIGSVIKERIDEISSQIYEHAGEEFNINSPVQLGEILFDKMGLTPGKKTKKGYSTSAEVLEKIADEHPIVPCILEYRTLTKLNGTYIEGLIPLIGNDGRIRAHFQQTVTATGRLSCTEPNLQNIPVRQYLGMKIRKAFVPGGDDMVFTGADYSQIELRVLAHMSEDPVLIGAFNEGQDIHRLTASRVLGVPEDEITPLQRSRAKAVNFGVIYGMSSFGLSSELHITRKEAEQYINDYFEKHAKVKEFMDRQVAECKEQGFVRTIMGRKRPVKEIHAGNYMVRQLGERLAMNSPIQGSAADIIKLAMIMVYDRLRREGLKSRLILQIHDELIIETYKDEKEQVEKLLAENMEKAMDLKVKLDVDLNSASTWYDLK